MIQNDMDTSRRVGFTIVELLIVIVVIGILAAITIMAYNGVQRRAQIVSVVDGLSKVDKSMRLWMIDTGMTEWPTEPVYSGGDALSTMITDNPALANYLQQSPAITGVGTQEWFYDNDVNQDGPSSDCGNMYDGVNVVIRYVHNQGIVDGIDKAIDGDMNHSCGKVRWDSTNGILFYALSYDGSIEQ